MNMKTISEMERELIIERMAYFEGNKTQTAHSLGITIKTLYNKLHEFGLFEQYKVGVKKPEQGAFGQPGRIVHPDDFGGSDY